MRLANGAEFVVAICGDIMTMPGLPRVPAANSIRIDAEGPGRGAVLVRGDHPKTSLARCRLSAEGRSPHNDSPPFTPRRELRGHVVSAHLGQAEPNHQCPPYSEHDLVVHSPERGVDLVAPEGHRLVDHDLRDDAQPVER